MLPTSMGGELLVDPADLVMAVEPFRFYDPDNTLLVESIREVGQLSPIVIWARPEGKFGYLAGKRRIDACKALGIKVRCVLGLPPASDAEAMKLHLDSNRVRYDTNPD